MRLALACQNEHDGPSFYIQCAIIGLHTVQQLLIDADMIRNTFYDIVNSRYSTA